MTLDLDALEKVAQAAKDWADAGNPMDDDMRDLYPSDIFMAIFTPGKVLELIRMARSRSVPEGWKLVPAEPTPEMCNAGNRAATEPGGVQCEKCGRLFIGEEWHSVCEVCFAAPRAEQPESQLRENIRLLLENDGGEGSKRYDATAFLTARDALRGWLTEQPEPSTTIPNYGDPKLVASISLRHKLNKAADVVSPFSNVSLICHYDGDPCGVGGYCIDCPRDPHDGTTTY